MFDEVIMMILRYCRRSPSLFCVNKTFNRLCEEIFIPSRGDVERAIETNHIFSMKRSLINQKYIKDIIKYYRKNIHRFYYCNIDIAHCVTHDCILELNKCCFVIKDLDEFKSWLNLPECYKLINLSTLKFIKDIDHEEYKEFINVIMKDSRINPDNLTFEQLF